MEMHLLETHDVDLLDQGRHTHPHQFLGMHSLPQGGKIIRLWAPKREKIAFQYLGQILELECVDRRGLFTFLVPDEATFLDYKVMQADGTFITDPYLFPPTISTVDEYLFAKGTHYTLYNILGARPVEHMGVEGVKFLVWAPHAVSVSLVTDVNHWKELTHPMRRVGESGIFEIFIPEMRDGVKYKFAIRTHQEEVLWKSDPFANAFELRPKTASVITNVDKFCWRDHEWMEKRKKTSPLEGPMNIYEMHLGSWMKKEKQFSNYREIASEIVPYLKEMGYTHLEILPPTEHPLDESWGYQVTGYFAPTSRFGTVEDFQYLINHLHMHQIGIIFDWAPGHFPDDAFMLSHFDGEPLYERNHHQMGRHPQWGTKIFDYARNEVSNFLIASALFWLEKMHVDAIRVDAVQSMIFLDYARNDGEWEANPYGGKENLAALEFLKHLNSIVHQKYPGVLMIAEDASIFSGITRPLEWGGLGFDLKWNLGWMKETLSFIKRDPIHRKYHMDELLNPFRYAFQERYILPISHDEVVHAKGSLYHKMHHEDWNRFAHLRLYYSAALCHPGKNLFFMGCELGMKGEWNVKGEIEWHLLNDPEHRKWKRFVREANHFYKKANALWEIDFDQKGFAWIDYNDYNNSIISYLRKGIQSELLCVHNYTPTKYDEYFIRLPNLKSIKEVFNSDEDRFGGGHHINMNPYVPQDKSGVIVKMPPLATMVFEVAFGH